MAYGRLWNNSQERTRWLPVFIGYYNNRREHSALGYNSKLDGTTSNDHQHLAQVRAIDSKAERRLRFRMFGTVRQ